MILLDCGNRALKAQYRENGRLRASFASVYEGDWCARLMRWMKGYPAMRCFQVSVLDAMRQQALDAVLAARFGKRVTRIVSERERLGIVSGYDEPQRLGADRWVALQGAAEIAARDCMIIDAGSAITIDLLRSDGRHLGGAILPGTRTSRERFRQIFSYIDFDDPRIGANSEPGGSTEAAIQIDYAGSSLDRLQELVTDWLARLDSEATLLLTGGDAVAVERVLDRPARMVPDLVFTGLARLAES